MMNNSENNAIKNAKKWTKPPFTNKTVRKVQELLKKDKKSVKELFSEKLSFGTGGLRALMGLGEARVNIYTVACISAGISSYLKEAGYDPDITVLIGFDARKNSALYAQAAALAFVHCGFGVQLFPHAVPTPLVSYWGRHSRAKISVVITASHNPKEYNGYKVYVEDGSQVASPLDEKIMHYVMAEEKYPTINYRVLEKLSNGNTEAAALSMNDWNKKHTFPALHNHMLFGAVKIVDDEVKQKYVQHLHKSLAPYMEEAVKNKKAKPLKVLYTALHGVGFGLMQMTFNNLKFAKLSPFALQCAMDGNFPTVAMPNPEEDEALKLSLAAFKKEGGDLLLATDADADRVRAASPLRYVANSEVVPFSGNEMAVLLVDFVVQVSAQSERKKSFFIKTIVTSQMITAVAHAGGVRTLNTLPGFKNISSLATEKKLWKNLLLGLEDSCGYNVGDFVRDKDGLQIALLITLACSYWKKKNLTLHQRLDELYLTHGYYLEGIVSLTKTNPKDITDIMTKLRANQFTSWGGAELLSFCDLQKTKEQENKEKIERKEIEEAASKNKEKNTTFHENTSKEGKKMLQGLPSTNAVWLKFSDGTTLLARPSGTEPKIKFYVQMVSSSVPKEMSNSAEKKEAWLSEMKVLLKVRQEKLKKELLEWLQ